VTEVLEKESGQPEGAELASPKLLAEQAAESMLVTVTVYPAVPPATVPGLGGFRVTIGLAVVQIAVSVRKPETVAE